MTYSGAFYCNTPFHHKVATLESYGATVLPNSSTIATNLLAETIGNGSPNDQGGNAGAAIYLENSNTDTGYAFACPMYTGGGPDNKCTANTTNVHYPSGALAQNHQSTSSQLRDHHLLLQDQLRGYEVDGYAAAPSNASPNACNINNPVGQVSCEWGGLFELRGSGLSVDTDDTSSANAAGYAYGIADITAYDMAQAKSGNPIIHALGLETACETAGSVYPAQYRPKSDHDCAMYEFSTPNTQYGDLVHIKSTVNVANLAGSVECKAVLKAFQDYGAYTVDNDGGSTPRSGSLALEFEGGWTYHDIGVPDSSNPWYSIYYPDMVAAGDGTGVASGLGTQFTFSRCLQNVTAPMIEILQLNMTTKTLPPIQTP